MIATLKIPQARLWHQGINGERFKDAVDVVRHLGAMQAQDYEGARWAIALRLPARGDHKASEHIDQAIQDRQILRTWPMRGTLHFVPAEDARWMLKLMASRVLAGLGRRHQQLGIDESVLTRSRELFETALAGGKVLTRDEMMQVLEQGGISNEGQRGYHLLGWHAQSGLTCFGPAQGKQQTFVLLDEWVKQHRNLSRDEALAEIARRFFTSHGPATIHDLARWTGLTLGDARQGLKAVEAELIQISHDGESYWCAADGPSATHGRYHLLPGFDEYLLGYKDRSTVLDPAHAQAICPGNNGMFKSTIVIDGQVTGTWARKPGARSVTLTLSPFRDLKPAELEGLQAAADRYGAFLNRKAVLILA